MQRIAYLVSEDNTAWILHLPDLAEAKERPILCCPFRMTRPRGFTPVPEAPRPYCFFARRPSATQLLHFATTLGDMATLPLAIFAVQHGRPDAALQAPFPVFFDAQGKVKAAYRLGHTIASTCFVLSPNLQVLTTLAVHEFAATVHQVLSTLASRSALIAPLEIHTQAPVLLIPRVLTPELCHTLIHVWETCGHVDTGVEHSHDRQRQDRIDHAISPVRTTSCPIRSCCGSSPPPWAGGSSPKCTKPLRFRRRGLKDSKSSAMPPPTGGFFQAHRDNLSPSTAHRRFALTLNLNEEYDGGHLRFPEYGPHLYRPTAGDAVVFACAHLHEVTRVTHGRRFTLLSFLFGDADVRASV